MLRRTMSSSSDSSDSEDDFQASRMQNLLSSFYGVVADETAQDQVQQETSLHENIDSSNFDADEYTVNMLHNESLAGLLNRDAKLVREIKTIDTDMKMLVHENYNKFISATDTIRNMRHNVSDMEEKMNELKTDMDAIYAKASTITEALNPTRNSIEKLVSVRQLLKKLEFLFELPLRLSRSIELKAYAQAVKYYTTARGVLQDHLDVPSFSNILREADTIINQLKSDIQGWIQVDDIPASKLAQYIKLLLSLDEDNTLLHTRYLEWHRRRLKWMLHRHSEEITLNNMNQPEEGWPFETMPIDEFVGALKTSVVQGFVDMCHMYVGIFGTAGFRANEPHPDLVKFGTELFAQYFALCKKKILSTSFDIHDTSLESLNTLSVALQSMQQSAQLIHQLVPKFRAHDRLAETLENAIRHQIEVIFKSLHISTMDKLASCFDMHQAATAQDAKSLASEIISGISNVLASLSPLVEIGTDIMSDIPRIFSDLVQGQLHGYFLWYSNAVESLTENDPRSAIIDDGGDVDDGHNIFDVTTQRKVWVDGSSAGIALLLAMVSKDVKDAGARNALKMLTDNLPYLRESIDDSVPHGLGVGNTVDIPDLVSRMQTTTQNLLIRYVHLLTDRLSGTVEDHFASVDWLRHEQPQAVSAYCSDLFSEMESIARDVIRITGADFALSTIPRRPVFKLPSGSVAGVDADSDAEPGIRINIERLFTQKMTLYEGITFAPPTIISACLTTALKSLYETARLLTFSKFAYQQAQIDASFLRVMLPRLGVKLDNGLDNLIDEFIGSVHERCIAPLDIDIAVVDSIVRSKRDEMGL